MFASLALEKQAADTKIHSVYITATSLSHLNGVCRSIKKLRLHFYLPVIFDLLQCGKYVCKKEMRKAGFLIHSSIQSLTHGAYRKRVKQYIRDTALHNGKSFFRLTFEF